MNTTAKKPFTPAPRMNVLKDQLKEQRFGLINKVKALREQRNALKGVKGSGQQWAELCAQIDELQAKIDLLSKSLGLPVKGNWVATNDKASGDLTRQRKGRSERLAEIDTQLEVGSHLTPTKPSVMCKDDLNHRQDNASQMVMEDEDRDAWDRLDESVNGNK